jgi:two-component system sensor histidine kinase/response regulator
VASQSTPADAQAPRLKPGIAPAAATPQAGIRPTPWAVFGLAATLAALASVAFVVWTEFRIGGDTTTIAVDDIGEAVAAGIAAVSCGLAALRNPGRMRLAWGLLGASALSWMVGEVVWSVYEVGMGISVPFPSAADAGFLFAVPLAVAGVMAFGSVRGRMATRGEAILAGAIVSLSLLFVAWALGLGVVYETSASTQIAQLIGLAYPVGDLIIITVLLMAVRRATRAQLGQMGLLLGGLLSSALADSTFAYMNANGTYEAIGSVLDAGWVVGYLLIALAPLWPAPAVAREVEAERPIELWQLALPWLAVLAAAVMAITLAIEGHGMDNFLTVLAGGIGVLFVFNQVLTHRDSLNLLDKSRHAELQLGHRTALLNQVIVQAPLGIARVGVDMRVIDANPRLGRLLGLNPTDMVGESVQRFLPAEEMTRVVDKFQPLWRGAVDTIESDSHALRADGSNVWLHWSATSVKKAGGVTDFFLAMFEDNTTQHTAQEAAMANLASLERLNRLKSEFVSLVSHEFRTALVGIQGFSEMIRDQDLEVDEVKSFAGDINKDAERLNRMITEMLDLDRIEAGRMTLHLAPVDMNFICNEAVERARATTSKHVVTTSLDTSVPAVRADSDRLFQVVSNLLSNAIKYSPAGGEISLTTQVDGGMAMVTIQDQGLGIPPDSIKKLFSRYERLEAGGGKIVGTGLGLAITRQIVEMHGGKIWVDSEVGKGSQFHFRIPLQGPEASAA